MIGTTKIKGGVEVSTLKVLKEMLNIRDRVRQAFSIKIELTIVEDDPCFTDTLFVRGFSNDEGGRGIRRIRIRKNLLLFKEHKCFLKLLGTQGVKKIRRSRVSALWAAEVNFEIGFWTHFEGAKIHVRRAAEAGDVISEER